MNSYRIVVQSWLKDSEDSGFYIPDLFSDSHRVMSAEFAVAGEYAFFEEARTPLRQRDWNTLIGSGGEGRVFGGLLEEEKAIPGRRTRSFNLN